MHWRGEYLEFILLWFTASDVLGNSLPLYILGGHKPHRSHSFRHYFASVRQEERQSGDFTRAAVSSIY